MGLLRVLRDNRAAALADRDRRDAEAKYQPVIDRMAALHEEILAIPDGPGQTSGQYYLQLLQETTDKIKAASEAPARPRRARTSRASVRAGSKPRRKLKAR